MRTAALSLEQAPPLSIPITFFLTMPFGILLAATILISTGSAAFISPWTPQALALTHAGTLGILAMGMLGTLYQMVPVVAGTAVPYPRLAHLVHALTLGGLVCFSWRLLGGPADLMTAAILLFTLSLGVFLLPFGWALYRSVTRNETIFGIRIAVLSLLAITLLGLLMAHGYADGMLHQDRVIWVEIHLLLALLGWVGTLIMAVSWQVIPMFYLAQPAEKPVTKWFTLLVVAGLILPAFVPLLPAGDLLSLSKNQLAAVATFPAAMVIWHLHPALILWRLARRKRKRADASLLFWKTGLATALLLIPVAIAALWLPDPRWQVLFGWLAIWAWAGMIIHGMLTRIVPFLVWFHRYSPRVGFEPVPSMRSLLSQEKMKVGFGLHIASVLSGVAAIVLQNHLLAQLTGVLLVGTAVSLFYNLLHTLRS